MYSARLDYELIDITIHGQRSIAKGRDAKVIHAAAKARMLQLMDEDLAALESGQFDIAIRSEEGASLYVRGGPVTLYDLDMQPSSASGSDGPLSSRPHLEPPLYERRE